MRDKVSMMMSAGRRSPRTVSMDLMSLARSLISAPRLGRAAMT